MDNEALARMLMGMNDKIQSLENEVRFLTTERDTIREDARQMGQKMSDLENVIRDLQGLVEVLEEHDQANLRRIEQLASRMRELEQGDTQRPLAE